ncbi:hypothetical protein KFL_001760140 [Klebsormidium nitens]|uniref:BTB domain-containing protein n=1 Tax=Klebsormidium nitens TaxID=105231 RepID=A0A1Y1HZM4_KLENI|nr:hypothetical protein KFL_001760140 [Klebsormidium nitens]|eukprot:GAQ84105.1 hypothetical protein KFL_001760140 [Klebsormidium nitens]
MAAACGDSECEKLFFNSSRGSDVLLTLQSESVVHEEISGARKNVAAGEVTLCLHSTVLKKYSGFFETLLSGRWKEYEATGNSPAILTLKDCKEVASYEKVLQYLYNLENGPYVQFRKLFCSVRAAIGLFEAANHLQILSLRERALGYIEAIPWNLEEMRLVQELCEQEIGTCVLHLRERLAQAPVPVEDFREEILIGLLKQDGSEEIRTIALELLGKGGFDDAMLENVFATSLEALKEKAKRLLFREVSEYSDLKKVLKSLWMLTSLLIEIGRDVLTVLKLMKEDIEDHGVFFRGHLWDEDWREIFHEQFYQHLISALRRGNPSLPHDSRAFVVSLWFPGTRREKKRGFLSREARVTAERAVFETLRSNDQRTCLSNWLEKLPASLAWNPTLKDWLISPLESGSTGVELSS